MCVCCSEEEQRESGECDGGRGQEQPGGHVCGGARGQDSRTEAEAAGTHIRYQPM